MAEFLVKKCLAGHPDTTRRKKDGCLCFNFYSPFGTIEVDVENGKNGEKQNRNNIFNPLDMGIKVGQGMEILQQTDGNQILPQQLRDLPVNLCQTAENCGNGPNADDRATKNRSVPGYSFAVDFVHAHDVLPVLQVVKPWLHPGEGGYQAAPDSTETTGTCQAAD